MPEKKQISITLTDLDDVRQVLRGLNRLFNKLIIHYTDDLDSDNLDIFILTFATYIGGIMRIAGYDEKYFGEKQWEQLLRL